MRAISSFVAAILFTFSVMLSGTSNAQVTRNLPKMYEEMLLPVVQVRDRDGSSMGSGLIIFSADRGKGVETYVLTNFHVVSDAIISVSDPAGGGGNIQRRTQVEILVYQYNNAMRIYGHMVRYAEIVQFDPDKDLALLKLIDTENVAPYVAKLAPKDAILPPMSHTWVIGAGHGIAPFAVEGLLANQDHYIEGLRYVLSISTISFGNSGGGLYGYSHERNQYELIGVVTAMLSSKVNKIKTQDEKEKVEEKKKEPVMIPVHHLSLSIPLETIYTFLSDTKLHLVE